MPLPSWPAALGEIRSQRDAFGAKINRAPKLVQFDDGPSGSRSAGQYVETPLTGSLFVSAANLPVLESFVRNDLVMGQARFTAPIAGPDNVVRTYTCRIVGEVEPKPWGLDWLVSFTLLVYGW